MNISEPAGNPVIDRTPAGSQSSHNVFVARQPIFDRKLRVRAYELLFRESLENYCPQGDLNGAASHVVGNAWLTFGFASLVGSKTGAVAVGSGSKFGE